MKFARYMRDRGPRAVTTRRLAMARRKLQASRDSVALFPELADQRTAEQVVADADAAGDAWVQRMRDGEARSWREARRDLRTLRPLQRAGILRWWQSPTNWVPRNAVYLLSAVHDAVRKRDCYWHRLATLRRFRLMGEGRLPWQARREPQTQQQISRRRHAENQARQKVAESTC